MTLMRSKTFKELPWQYKVFVCFAGVKPLLGLALFIQGIIMITYSPPPCEDFDKCPWFAQWYCQGDGTNEAFRDTLDRVPANYGICGLALGLGVMATGACSFLAARKRQRRWMVVQMIIDMAMCGTSAILGLLCFGEAANLENSCEALKELQAGVFGNSVMACDGISQMIQDLCDFVSSFHTLAILFLVLFAGVLAASILDCMVLCCCSPEFVATGAPQSVKTPEEAVVGTPVQ